jgi:hypothetical protein
MSAPITYDMNRGSPVAPDHKFFSYVGATPDRAVVRELALQLANHYLRKDLSRNGWRKEPAAACRWELRTRGAQGQVAVESHASKVLHLRDFEQHLMASGKLDFELLGLPDPMCPWLDSSLMMAPQFHAVASTGKHALTFCAEPNLGPCFPLVPTLDREGVAFTSLQTMVVKRISTLRAQLVADSAAPEREDWFQLFRNLISESVALIENTIHQVYFKAEYDPLPGWRFDRAALGDRHNRRVVDKLRWVFQITGNQLDARDEVKAFSQVKTLRNHLLHFDPPSFACSWEEMSGWLNSVLGVVRLAWRIRACVGALPSAAMIELLLQRAVSFTPQDPTRKRIDPPGHSGYASTSAEALSAGRRPSLAPEAVLLNLAKETRIL